MTLVINHPSMTVYLFTYLLMVYPIPCLTGDMVKRVDTEGPIVRPRSHRTVYASLPAIYLSPHCVVSLVSA